MRSLLETQRAFAGALHAPDSERMHAYRANVWGNWSAALAGAYPIVCKIVGEAFFELLAREYARAHRSTSGDLNEYGARLDEFVANFVKDLPYLPDVARMEWLAHRAYYAADRPAFDPSRLHALRLAPGCALLESPWPLARIWQVHQDDYPGEVAVDLSGGAQRILVHRPNWRAEVQALDAGDYLFLESLDAGLGSALQAAVAADPGFDPAHAPAYWVSLGVLVT